MPEQLQRCKSLYYDSLSISYRSFYLYIYFRDFDVMKFIYNVGGFIEKIIKYLLWFENHLLSASVPFR